MSIGGAVITQGFADEIGADGYSEDAQNAVEVIGKLLAERDKINNEMFAYVMRFLIWSVENDSENK